MVAQDLPLGPLQACPESDPQHAVWNLLEKVTDPEIPVVSLREMGILRAVRQHEDVLEVVITPTYSGCPAMAQMHDDVVSVLAQAGLRARVLTQLAPAWSSDWITPQAQEKLRRYGIAPPHACAAAGASQDKVLQFARNQSQSRLQPVACPQCESLDTTEISHFGSTACKALYRCLACMEPFDYFKPY